MYLDSWLLPLVTKVSFGYLFLVSAAEAAQLCETGILVLLMHQ